MIINAQYCEHSEICIEIVGVDRRDEHIYDVTIEVMHSIHTF